MANCKACGEWFVSSSPAELCMSCERALKRLGKYVAPVVHGYWVLEAEKGTCMDFHVKAHCSECGHKWFGENGVGNYSCVFSAFVRGSYKDAIEFVLREASKIKIDRFCSACGAKMDKEATDGD